VIANQPAAGAGDHYRTLGRAAGPSCLLLKVLPLSGRGALRTAYAARHCGPPAGAAAPPVGSRKISVDSSRGPGRACVRVNELLGDEPLAQEEHGEVNA
jgi:hypothetical protein